MVETLSSNEGFDDLGLRPELLQALTVLGYEEATPIQRETIPHLIAGRDLLGQAATGTGKTAAFALPMLHTIPLGGVRPAALVLVPTRELAIQVGEAIHRYGKQLGVRVLPIYGGAPIGRQIRTLERGVDVVVATPGRALDHIGRGTLILDSIRTVVLDEADEMLDMGFAEDIESILGAVPAERQTVLFSATLPPRVQSLTKKYLKNPVNIRIGRDASEAGTLPKVRQTAYVVQRPYKLTALGRILDLESPTAALVFCRTRTEVDQLTEALNARGYRAEALHGGMSQDQRDRVMNRLRAGTADLLIATDVAARGLDIDQLTHVVNYDVPSATDAYVHRIGRVGRAGREGVAITLAEPREHHMLRNIERATKQKISIETVPTVADLKARRLDLMRATLRETILEDDFDGYRVVIESLCDEFDLMDIGMAAVKLAHEASAPAEPDEREIPETAIHNRDGDRDRGRGRDRYGSGYGSGSGSGYGSGYGSGPGSGSGSGSGKGVKSRKPGSTRIYIGAGRNAGVRPQDLVGAIANEARLAGRDIGAIEISDNFSLVELPEHVAGDVIAALRDTTIKGKKVKVRLERF